MPRWQLVFEGDGPAHDGADGSADRLGAAFAAQLRQAGHTVRGAWFTAEGGVMAEPLLGDLGGPADSNGTPAAAP